MNVTENSPKTMRTVDKAMNLLNYFSTEKPEYGLSELAREAGLDKATTLRIMVSLARHGFIEQHPETKKYRLGNSVLRLARIREASFPVFSIVEPVLNRLAETTGETAHASLMGGTHLITIGIAEPQRSTRVHVDPAQTLPFHATASGLAFLAFASQERYQAAFKPDSFERFTDETVTSPEALRKRVEETRQTGYAVARGSFEDEVIGIASPIFGWQGHASGAIAVASVASRLTPEAEKKIAGEVIMAAIDVTRALGAEPDSRLLQVERKRRDG